MIDAIRKMEDIWIRYFVSRPSDDPNTEIVECAAKAGDELIILRNKEGTGVLSINDLIKSF